MASAVRSLLICLAIMAAAMAGSWLLSLILQRLPAMAMPIVIFGGIGAALWWRIRWGIRNPLPKGDTDHW